MVVLPAGCASGRYRFRLQFDPKIREVNLALIDSAGKSFQLGWDDQAHWHSHVLRCEELDVICRSIAKLDSSLPHPGVPYLLFWRFAVAESIPRSALAIEGAVLRPLGLLDLLRAEDVLRSCIRVHPYIRGQTLLPFVSFVSSILSTRG